MKIDEFLTNNPTFNVSDLDMVKSDGIYDENALKALNDNLNSPEKDALRGVYKPILELRERMMIKSIKQTSRLQGV